MKSFYKNALVISAICIILGLGMTIGGAAKGGIDLFRRMVNDGELSFSYNGNSIGMDENSLGAWEKDTQDRDHADEVYEYEFKVSEYEIDNLDLSVGATALWIEYEDTDSFHITIEKSKIGGNHSCEVKENTLYVSSATEEVENILGDNKPHKIKLTIPKDYVFKEVKISLGAGNVEGEKLEAEQILADIGAGNMQIETMKAEKNIEVSVGAGNFEVEEIKAEELEIVCEAGRAYAQDTEVKKNVTLTCDAGYVYMDIKENQESYNYYLECSMGSISVGGESHSGLAFRKAINNQVDRTVKAECNIGAIEIEFDE